MATTQFLDIPQEDQHMFKLLHQKYPYGFICRTFQELEQQSCLSSLSSTSTRPSSSFSNHPPFQRPDSTLSQYQTSGRSSCTSFSDSSLKFSANSSTSPGNSHGHCCETPNSGYAAYSSTSAPNHDPIFLGPAGIEQTPGCKVHSDQMEINYPAAEDLLIPSNRDMSVSEKLYFCTFAAEKGETKPFGTKSDWKKHEKNFHETGKEYQCPDPNCSQIFNRDYDYYQHCHKRHRSPKVPASEMMVPLPAKAAFGCGFKHCKAVLYSWDQRCNHVADHMKNGMTPSQWSYSNVIRNLLRQESIHDVSKEILGRFCHQNNVDRSRLFWLPDNTKALRQNLECGNFHPSIEMFVYEAMELSSVAVSRSPDQASALPNEFTIPTQDSISSAAISSMPQNKAFLMANSMDFDGTAQSDPSQLSYQLQLPFENLSQLPSTHAMDISTSHCPNYEQDPDSFYQTQPEFGYPTIDPMLTQDSFPELDQIQAESNLASQLQYQQNDFSEYSNQEPNMHPLEHYKYYYEPLPPTPLNPGRSIMNGLMKVKSNLSSRKPQHFQPTVNSEELLPSLPMHSRTLTLGSTSAPSSFYPGNHNEVTDIDDGIYRS